MLIFEKGIVTREEKLQKKKSYGRKGFAGSD